MRDRYVLDFSLHHEVQLNDGEPYDEIIKSYSARILFRPAGTLAGEDEGVLAGTFHFYVANIALAANQRVDMVDVADSLDADLEGYCSAVFEPGTASVFQEEVDEQFDCALGSSVLFLHLAKVFPEHRGKNVGLVAAHKIIEQFGDGLVVLGPAPLQHRSGFSNEEKMRYETLEADRKSALKRLSAHWQRLGFVPIGDTGYLGLSTDKRHPVPQLGQAKSAAKRPTKKPTTKKGGKK